MSPATVKVIVGICFLSLSFLSGCATTATKEVSAPKERFFWPPLPDTPRIEFIDTHTGAKSLAGEVSVGFLDFLVGEDGDQFLLSAPVDIVSNGSGKIYVVDQKNGRLPMFDMKKRAVSSLGGGEGERVFTRPTGISIDSDGNIYVADTSNRKIYILDPSGSIKNVLTISDHVTSIGGLVVDSSRKRLLVADIRGHKIATFGLDGSHQGSFGKRGGGDGEFNFPTAVALDREGNIVICDSLNARIQRFTPDLKFINAFGRRGDGLGDFAVPKGVAVDSEGHIYVTDGKSNKIGIFNNKGELLLEFGATFMAKPGLSITPGGLYMPMGIFIDQNDTIYVVENMNARFQIFQYMNEKYVKENPYENKNDKPVTGK